MTRKFDDDARLTAYALGELEGEERAEIEALLAAEPEARRVVDEVHAAAGVLGAAMTGAPAPALEASQRAAVVAKAARPHGRLRRMWPAAAAAAAGVALGFVVRGEVRSARPELTVPDDVALGEGLWGPSSNGLFAADHPDVRLGYVGGDVDRAGLADHVGSGGGGGNSGEPGRQDPARLKGQLGRDFSRYFGGGGGAGVGPSGALDRYTPSGEGGRVDDSGLEPSSHPRARVQRRDPLLDPRRAVLFGTHDEPVSSEGPNKYFADYDGLNPFDDVTNGLDDSASVGFESTITQAADIGDPLRTEAYAHIEDNPFRRVGDAPLSTFGIDVDTASYSNVRRFLRSGQLPPPGAVRIEELLNYFPYDYAPPTDGRPFAVHLDVAGCPWNQANRLVRVALKGKVVEAAARPAANLVFLVDVSGSMDQPNKLPLVVQSMRMLVERLEPRDRVAIVVYAGASGMVLPSTSCEDKAAILGALDALRAGGSTNGGAGIELAYQTAVAHRVAGGINRVVLCTDGDFNVGVTDESSLVKLIEEKRKEGVFLSVLGYGMDNLNDSTLEKLADKGNGNYAYIDTEAEARKALVEQVQGTLVTIAKDVKIQVEFNPVQVGSWRLLGYENRVMRDEEFRDDAKDAGEIGAGHTVTALYEIVPAGTAAAAEETPRLRYQTGPRPSDAAASGESLVVRLRWKEPEGETATETEFPVIDHGTTYGSAPADFQFAASVAGFGMLLRDSPHKGTATWDQIIELATTGLANDRAGWRAEFVELARAAKTLATR